MRKIALLLVFATALALGPGMTTQADDDSVTLNGKYVWNNRGISGDLEAVFTPTEDENTWNVSFFFEFRDEPHTYTGTAQGNLKDGELSGKVKTENKSRTFSFKGSFDEEEIFTGTHAEWDEGEEFDTGTMTLSRG